ncbi:hypothetical protein EHF33_09800 [Deinococcus psychrotolerans]|uniref:Uncharacterized protein n=1 Tax=Deinococcus psychrotolerans TaxID=2489213 RepID=A0A3G8YFP1_9DEIO|nr:hypothetical protein [Deinococcus psychrotolerans]AZI42997.1 hypothetical protein EHF33_09800 [Deinococcus psychrotolerans]
MSGRNFKRVSLAALTLLTAWLPAQAQQAGAMPPPEIVQLIEKLSKGQELTPAEEKKLDDWSAAQSKSAVSGESGGASGSGSSGAASLSAATGSAEGQGVNPCPTAPSHAPVADTPSASAYAALVKSVQAGLSAKLDPAQLTALNQNLATQAQPQDASNVGLFLLAQNMGRAGAYAISKSALNSPSDATYANNLGVALRGLRDFPSAEQALLYAAFLNTGTAAQKSDVQVNLGWLALDQQRVDAAQNYFNVGLRQNPKAAQAMAGLGLIALCQGHPKQALPLFQGSLQNGFTDFAEAGLNTAEGVLGRSAKGQQILAKTPPLFPDVKGVEAGDEAYWKLPPFDPSAISDVLPESKQPLLTYTADLLDLLKQAQARATQAALKDTHTLDRAPTKARFVLGDLATITNARLDGPQTALNQAQADASADLNRIVDAAQSFTCAAVTTRREQALAVHTRFFPVYAAAIHQMDAVLGDMWALGSPWIAGMKDGSDQAAANLQRVTVVDSALVEAAQELSLYQVWLTAALQPDFVRDSDGRSCPLKSAEVLHPVKLGKLKTFPDKACNLPSESMPMILASYQADCTGIHLAFGEGARLKLDYTFGKDWASDSLTISGGLGFAESENFAGSGKSTLGVGVNDEVVSFVTLTGIGQLVPAFDDAGSAAGAQNLASTAEAGAQAFADNPAKYIADYGTAGTAKAGVSGGEVAKIELTVSEKLSAVTGFSSAVTNSSGLGPNTNFKDVE